MIRRTLSLALAALLVAATLTGAGATSALAQESEDAVCDAENTLTFDEFRSDDPTLSAFADSGNESITKSNTEVRVNTDGAFARVSVTNPNTYCIQVAVEMADEVVTPSTLGTIDATDASVTADWRAVHDFDSEETYTDITATIPAETTATFAPSKLRIKSLGWTDLGDSSGILSDIRDSLGLDGSAVENRTHTVDGNTSEQVTIPLTHPENADERIEGWQATYTLDDDPGPNILSQDSGDPVFYRTVDDGDAIEIVYNERATVEFTADPTIRDRVEFELDSFLSSLRDAFDLPNGVFS